MRKADLVSYADNNIVDVIKSHSDDSLNLFKLCLDNQMETNNGRCHLITNKPIISMKLKINNLNNENSTCEKLRKVMIDYKVYFSEHLEGMTKKTSGKVTISKRSVLINSFFTS